MPLVKIIFGIILIIAAVYVAILLAVVLFWIAVGILGIGIIFGGSVSIYNYTRSFIDNVGLEKPMP